jgi:hypothetical protein
MQETRPAAPVEGAQRFAATRRTSRVQATRAQRYTAHAPVHLLKNPMAVMYRVQNWFVVWVPLTLKKNLQQSLLVLAFAVLLRVLQHQPSPV